MATIDWLNERIADGEALLIRLRDLGADAHSPALRDVRSFLMEFRDWDTDNQADLGGLFGNDSPWVAQYRGIRQVDQQLALTDFVPQREGLEACVHGKLDQLKSIREAVVRRVVPRGRFSGRVFLGHGRSPDWRELEHYVTNVLRIESDELERQPADGPQVADRLDHMLDTCQFAVLVMTAEDVRRDGSAHAREDVVHEIGLFQGRLGRARVVLLLEEGCSELTNIRGVVHVGFPAGRIASTFETVRRALIREGLLQGQSTAVQGAPRP